MRKGVQAELVMEYLGVLSIIILSTLFPLAMNLFGVSLAGWNHFRKIAPYLAASFSLSFLGVLIYFLERSYGCLNQTVFSAFEDFIFPITFGILISFIFSFIYGTIYAVKNKALKDLTFLTLPSWILLVLLTILCMVYWFQ